MKDTRSVLWNELSSRLMPRLRILVTGLAGVWVFYHAWQLIDPAQEPIVTKETTFITEPLAEDGWPDYPAALLARQRRAKPDDPSQNGAIQFWRVIGPGVFEERHKQLFFDELGCPIPQEQGYLVGLKDAANKQQVKDWMKQTASSTQGRELESAVDRYLDLCFERKWPANDHRVLAAWQVENARFLDELANAIDMQHFYSPSPSLLEEESQPLIAALLCTEQGARRAFRGLCARAMQRLGSGDQDGSIRDIRAVCGYAEWLGSSDFLVSQVVGVIAREQALRAISALVAETQDQRQLDKVQQVLEEHPEPDGVGEGLRYGETLVFNDSLLRTFVTSRQGADVTLAMRVGGWFGGYDLDEVLRVANSWYAEAGEIASIENRSLRRASWTEFELKVEALDNDPDRETIRSKKWGQMGKPIAEVMVSAMLPAVGPVFIAEDRAVARQRMTMITVLVRSHRLRTGAYLESLEFIDQQKHSKTLVDPFTNQPFRYERRGDGFLLYSLGPNGVDDGASDRTGEFVEGEYAPIDWFGERDEPDGPDDIVVRLPVPELEVPHFGEE